MSRFTAFPRSAILGAALAVLALGLFSASAVSWSGGEESGGTGPTGPVGATGQTGPQGTEQTQPTVQAPQGTQPAAPQSAPATQPATPPAAPKGNLEVKGETGTRGKSNSGGHSGRPVVAQAPS